MIFLKGVFEIENYLGIVDSRLEVWIKRGGTRYWLVRLWYWWVVYRRYFWSIWDLFLLKLLLNKIVFFIVGYRGFGRGGVYVVVGICREGARSDGSLVWVLEFEVGVRYLESSDGSRIGV